LGAEADLRIDRARWEASPAGIAALWVGVLAGPVVWAADLVAGYALVAWTCGHHRTAPLHLLSFAALLVIGLASWISLRAAMVTREPAGAAAREIARDERTAERAQFMAGLGLASSALFAIVVVATEIPRWVFDACR
jgi:hypothetical protein